LLALTLHATAQDNQKATMRTMQTPVTANDNNAPGFFIDSTDTEEYFQHSGGNEGFRSTLFAGETGHQGVVVMINSNNDGILREICCQTGSMSGLSAMPAGR
jgi:hypothetical protein